jgi:hypothetical protein
MADTTAETNERRRQSRTERELAVLESTEQAKSPPKKKKKVHVEKTTVKQSSNAAENARTDKRMQPVRERLRAAVLAKNKTKAGNLRSILLEMQRGMLKE